MNTVVTAGRDRVEDKTCTVTEDLDRKLTIDDGRIGRETPTRGVVDEDQERRPG